MQIITVLSAFALLTTVQIGRYNSSIVPLEKGSIDSRSAANETRRLQTYDSDGFTLASEDCFSKEICLVFVSVKKKLQNEDGLTRISRQLSKRNPRKQRLNIFFFDSFNTAKSFAEGKIHPTEIDLYAVGEYRFDEKEEYLKMRILDSRKSNLSGKRPEWRTVFKTSNK
ncbi:MAG: hypothetical protein C4325_10375 [Blastocatellia bacterium]